MKFDTSGLDPELMARHLAAAYGLPLTSPHFLPLGEDQTAFHWRIATAAGGGYFVTAHRGASSRIMDVAAAYAAVAALVTDCALQEIVAPLPTLRGGFTSTYLDWRLALFPFVPGTVAAGRPLSEAGLRQIGLLLARLHESRTCLRTAALGHERFASPFPAQLRDCLRTVEALPAGATVYQRRLRDLLLREQTDLVTYLDELAQLDSDVRALPVEQVVTHGDLNLTNILVDAGGELYLVDWDGIALAPSERDLWTFSGEHLEPLLNAYAGARRGLRLSLSMFAYYRGCDTVLSIVDRVTRILYHNRDPREDEHAWQQLAAYLPLPRERLSIELREIESILERVAGSP
jgi:Ser/Thr protein kinase RdoA (MazF antagonist)